MQKKLLNKLNLDLILKNIDNYCYSDISKNRFKNLEYIGSYEELIYTHKKNEEAETLLRKYSEEINLKIYDYYNSIKKAKVGSILSEKELFQILKTIKVIRIFKNKFENIQENDNYNYKYISGYIDQLQDVHYLENYLDKIVDEDGYIKSDASIELFHIKNEIRKLKNKSDNVLKNIIRKNINKLSEAIITKRNDKNVILVKPEYKNDFGGIIHDESASGNTFYVEPRENVIINNEISILQRKEKDEILKILRQATELVDDNNINLKINLDNFSEVEFVFSRVNFSLKNNFTQPSIINSQVINLKKMYNPLIEKNKVIKNDVYLNNKDHSLIITGPNTGGKTVVLKTVGLCVLLSHLGFYIPANIGSEIGYYDNIFVDIGDDQSIEQNLSTFSSHMHNIINILNKVTHKSLVLIDELCSGTDPSEGTALSIAILNKLKLLKSTVLCTTHYPDIKDYCFSSDYYVNSSLEFDFEKLKPTYKFIIGLPGKSNAINISYNIGLEDVIVNEAREYISNHEKENSILIDSLSEKIKEYDYKVEYVNLELENIEKIKNTLYEELNKYYQYKESIYNEEYEKLNKEITKKQEKMLEIYKEFKNKTTLKQHEYNETVASLEKHRTNTNLSSSFNISENKKLKDGDDVLVIKYNQRGTILKIINNKYQVKMGSMKLTLDKNEIKYLEKEKKYTKYVNNTVKLNSNVSLSINVIGKNTEEAILEIDKYIDKILLTGYDSFTIIHGLGSGILKKNISKYLDSSKYVTSYRTGNQNEGGLGVTIVEMS